LLILFKQNFLLNKYMQEAKEITRRKDHNFSDNGSEKLITISAQNPRNDFTCICNNIMYFHAQDNYVIIHFIKDSNYIKEIIRTTLKKVKYNLNEYPNFFHCHKSYIVNLDNVIKVSGNAQGLKLSFRNINEIIPVSRQLHQEFMHIYAIN
ncbi:LytR/AlgR family response regulator transcription factor, partial [Bacteroidota bacterium]